MLFFDLLIIGILTGAVYALIGIGFTMAIGVAKVVNFAHGAFVALGMFASLVAFESFGVSPYIALPFGMAIFFALGVLMAIAMRRAEVAGHVGQLIIGLAVLLLIESLIAISFGTEPRTLNLQLQSVNIMGSTVQVTRILAFAVALALALGIRVLVGRSWLGRAMRAVAADPDAAALQGIKVRQVQTTSVALSVALAGGAGIVISPFVVLTPFTGTEYLLVAFSVVVLGGLGNPTGALVAAMAIGVIQALSSGYLDSGYATLIPLLLVLAILSVRPSRMSVAA